MSYHGKARCGGCGLPGDKKPRRSSADLCDDCEGFIKLGQVMAGKHSGEYVQFNHPRSFFKGFSYTVFKGSKTVKTEHVQQGPYVSDAFDNRTGDGAMTYCLVELLKSFDEGDTDTMAQVHFVDSYHEPRYYIKKSVAIAIMNFIKTAFKWAGEIEHDAFTEGRDLLAGLATGKHTVEYFDERVARESKSYNERKKR